jgi:hypothetical protein
MMGVVEPDLPDAVRLISGKGGTAVPLLYDAAVFDVKRRAVSATNPGFVDALRVAGARPILLGAEAYAGKR